MSDFDNNPYAASNVTDDFDFQQGQTPVKVPDYLVPSILVTIFCCQFLFGVLAIVFSALANGEKKAGNYQKALSHANLAKIFLIIAVVFGALLALYWIVMIVIAISQAQVMP